VTRGICNHLGAIFEMQPLQNLAHVIADGHFAEMKRLSYLWIGLSLSNQCQDFNLARSQFRRRLLRGALDVLRLAGELFEQQGCQVRRQRSAA